jgi:hypothetical protein
MRNTIRTTALLVMLFAALGSCVKGDKGATGPAGTNGTNGTNGAPGNANVGHGTITLTSGNWTYNSANWEYYSIVTDNGITQSVVDNGSVAVFKQDGSSWVALPFTYYYSATGSYQYSYEYYLGNVKIFMQLSSNTTFTSIADATFKVIDIDGAHRQAYPNTDWKNYDEVKTVMGKDLNETTVTATKAY